MNSSSRKRHREMHSTDFLNVPFELFPSLKRDRPVTKFHKIDIVLGDSLSGGDSTFIMFTTMI